MDEEEEITPEITLGVILYFLAGFAWSKLSTGPTAERLFSDRVRFLFSAAGVLLCIIHFKQAEILTLILYGFLAGGIATILEMFFLKKKGE